MTEPNNVPHKPTCLAYLNAKELLGVDRTGMCDCGAAGQPWQAAGKATALRISIQSIPHKSQRYDTCGDYYYGIDHHVGEETLFINISELSNRREMLLVAIHELIEFALCEAAGISLEEIDKFDKDDEFWALIATEPGDCIQAPYYKEHQIATGIERILAAEMGVDWLEYERHIEELNL